MIVSSSQVQPSDAELELIILTARHNMHRSMNVSPHRGRQKFTGRKIFVASMVTLACVGGGAAVANVGPFSPTEPEGYSNVEGPVGKEGNRPNNPARTRSRPRRGRRTNSA